MPFLKLLVFLDLIIPFVMIVIGLWLKSHPYSTIGSNGYSTPASRCSQQAWEFAQKEAPFVFLSVGKPLFFVLCFFNLLLLLFPLNLYVSITIGCIIGFLGLFFAFYQVERKIKVFSLSQNGNIK